MPAIYNGCCVKKRYDVLLVLRVLFFSLAPSLPIFAGLMKWQNFRRRRKGGRRRRKKKVWWIQSRLLQQVTLFFFFFLLTCFSYNLSFSSRFISPSRLLAVSGHARFFCFTTRSTRMAVMMLVMMIVVVVSHKIGTIFSFCNPVTQICI